MLHRLPPRLGVGFGVLALAACGGETPTQPEAVPVSAPAAAVTALASNTWTLKAAYPSVFGAIGLSAGVVTNSAGQSTVYAFGGTDDQGGSGVSVLTYNAATNTWSSKGFEPRVYVFDANGVGRIGGKFYISGGYDYSGGFASITSRLSVYDPANNTLTQKASMPKATADGITGVIDGKLYVLPGTCSTDFFPTNPAYCETALFRRLFRYNPTLDRWATKRPAPHFHQSGAGGVINGKFYAAGGFGDLGPVRALDVYDPATDTWQSLAQMPVGGHARGAVLGGKLYVVVDRLKADGSTELHTYVYNPATNTWGTRATPSRPHPAVVTVSINGQSRLLALGGVHYAPGAIVNASELFTP